MGTISVAKYEFKRDKIKSLEKEYKKVKESDSNDKSEFLDFVHKAIITDINGIKITLEGKMRNPYTKTELLAEIRDKLIKKKLINKIKEVNPDNYDALEGYLKKSFAAFLDQKLDKWNVNGDIMVSKENGGIQFSLTIDSFEIAEFKNNFTAIPETYPATVVLDPYKDYIIAYIIGNPTEASFFRSFIKVLLEGYKFQIIKWDDQALRQIKEDLSSNFFGVKAKNVEAKVNIDAHSEDLDKTKIYKDIEPGTFSGITYIMKEPYTGYSISIHGFYGTIRSGSDISDDMLIQYIKENLLEYSSLTHTTQDS